MYFLMRALNSSPITALQTGSFMAYEIGSGSLGGVREDFMVKKNFGLGL